MTIEPFEIGVCSWSMQVTSVPELEGFCKELGVDVVQIALGDPVHASWNEGDGFAKAAAAADFRMSGAMLGFPGEDYTTPQTIRATGGFGDAARRQERLERVQWAVDKTVELGVSMFSIHAGFIPEEDGAERNAILDCLAKTADAAAAKGLTVSLETGQETAVELKRLLKDLAAPNVKVNFDPANVLLYDMGEPIAALETLAEHVVHVHCKDANGPTTKGQWGQEMVLGQGQVGMAAFVDTLKKIGYQGPLVIEREAGTQDERKRDIAAGISVLRECVGRRG
jgi:L-ribulose-5-phosphate 3-epimerase